MIVKQQKPIEIQNTCKAIFDEEELKKAIEWYSQKPVSRLKTVYLYCGYPAVSVYLEKIKIHRLLWMYWNKSDIDENTYIHHKNRNKLDARKENLEAMDIKKHQSLHNKDKRLSKEHRMKISEANKKRKGIQVKKRVDLLNLKEIIESGMSINKIAKYYGCDWTTIKSRIESNPELLNSHAKFKRKYSKRSIHTTPELLK